MTEAVSYDSLWAWSPQPGPQSDACATRAFCGELFYGGAAGGGKGLLPDEPILTPFGFRPLSSLEVGSRVCTTDGQTQQIIGYFPRGKQPTYRLQWSDGTSTTCDADHIWLGYRAGRGQKRAGERVFGPQSARKFYTRDLLEMAGRFGVPVMDQPCVFNVAGEQRGRYKHISRSLSPYVIGALIGDGYLNGTGVRLSSEDDEILARVARELPEGALVVPYGGIDYGITGIRGDLGDLDLCGTRAETKHIPRIYKLGSSDERWALMQGLMDTDGWSESDGDCYYCTVSPRLRDDVAFVARSLGAFVTVREKTPECEGKKGQRAYTLRIKIKDPSRLFSLTRKSAHCDGRAPQSMTRWLDSIEPAGEQETICIAVSHPNSLFIAGDFTVTHNTDFLLGDFAADVDQGAAWTGILFRLSYPDLDEVIERSQQIYPFMGAEYLVGQRVWKWPGGATLRLRHLEQVNDFSKYLGHSYAWVGWDELPTWETLKPYHMMKSRLRGEAKHKRIRATGNPGGRCHTEIKEYFGIGEHPNGGAMRTDPESGMTRMFIPSKVRDNRILLQSDPGYMDRLKAVGDPELVAAWLDGDWDAMPGSYFSMFRRSECECEPFEIPQGWTVFTCMDYGEENPAWCGVLAVDFDDDVWVVDEYYRAGAGGADHARAVRAMIDNCPYIRGVRPKLNLAPHDMWTRRRPGEASQALSPADTFTAEGVHLTRANMDRVNGWRNVKDLLYANRLRFFRGRTERICSSLASVQRDPKDPEDVLKGGDDHPADGLRYGINHVYKPRRKIDRRPPMPNKGQAVLDSLMQMAKPQGRYA